MSIDMAHLSSCSQPRCAKVQKERQCERWTNEQGSDDIHPPAPHLQTARFLIQKYPEHYRGHEQIRRNESRNRRAEELLDQLPTNNSSALRCVSFHPRLLTSKCHPPYLIRHYTPALPGRLPSATCLLPFSQRSDVTTSCRSSRPRASTSGKPPISAR